MDIFIMLIVMMVSQMYTQVKTQQKNYFTYGQFMLCQLYINKPVFKILFYIKNK